MGHITYGYKMNERGRIIHKTFDIDDLLHGEGKRHGWYDAPDKVPGYKKAQEAADARKAETARTIAPEPKPVGTFHGEKRKPGRPRKQ